MAKRAPEARRVSCTPDCKMRAAILFISKQRRATEFGCQTCFSDVAATAVDGHDQIKWRSTNHCFTTACETRVAKHIDGSLLAHPFVARILSTPPPSPRSIRAAFARADGATTINCVA